MQDLPYRLDRTVTIKARPETVFRFFTDSARWAAWWGAGSTIDALPGGKVYVRHANGVESRGEVMDVRAPDRIVFTYGFVSGKPIPAGSSLVTIHLEPVSEGTRLILLHEFADAAARDEHVQGWRFQLSLFSNAVANEVFANAAAAVDGWFAAWSVPNDGEREKLLASVAAPGIQFRDRYSSLEGMADVVAHTGAAQRFMPGITLRRKGDVRQCQGTVLANWVAVDRGEKELMSGVSVLVFDADGRIVSGTGFAG